MKPPVARSPAAPARAPSARPVEWCVRRQRAVDRGDAGPSTGRRIQVRRRRSRDRGVALQARHHIAPNVGQHGVTVVGVQRVAGYGRQRDHHSGNPFRCLWRCRCRRWTSPRVARGHNVTRPEFCEVGDQALHAGPRAGGELLGFLGAEFHQHRAGVVVRPQAVADARRRSGRSSPSICSSMACASDQNGVVEAHDHRAEQRHLVRKVAIQPSAGQRLRPRPPRRLWSRVCPWFADTPRQRRAVGRARCGGLASQLGAGQLSVLLDLGVDCERIRYMILPRTYLVAPRPW